MAEQEHTGYIEIACGNTRTRVPLVMVDEHGESQPVCLTEPAVRDGAWSTENILRAMTRGLEEYASYLRFRAEHAARMRRESESHVANQQEQE